MKYSLTFTDDRKIQIVKKFQATTKKYGFKQNALLLEYMDYITHKLEQHEALKKASFGNTTQLDVYFDKNRIELGLVNEKGN